MASVFPRQKKSHHKGQYSPNYEESHEEEKLNHKNNPPKSHKKQQKGTKEGNIEEEEKISRDFLKSLKKDFYIKRDKEPDEILPGFYLGSIGAAYNKRALQECKIEYILCCSDGIESAFPTSYTYKILKLHDTPFEDITRFFEESTEFIHNALSKGKRVLVHCYAGRSRSATIVISYLLKYRSMTLKYALEFVKKKRAAADPNRGFLEQLGRYEKTLRGELETGS